MSIVRNPDNPSQVKSAVVEVTVETDAVVMRCDRCSTEAPCEVVRQIETDNRWENGAIKMLDRPEKWLRWHVGSMYSQTNDPRWSRILDLCPDCAPLVAKEFEKFTQHTGLDSMDIRPTTTSPKNAVDGTPCSP